MPWPGPAHPIPLPACGEVVLAAVAAGLTLLDVGEHAPDAEFARRYPRAERYVGWPMLLVLVLRAATTPVP
ncbi:MAG: hypothetical protein J4F37_00690 [Acidobacteria bacterium]|nr:hypothetical protein [Acidobacteriota bacterium]